MLIDAISRSERADLLSIAVATGLFSADDAEALLGGALDQLFAGTLPDGHTVLCCRVDNGPPIGWTYVAPDQHAQGVWNVWWIGVAPSAHGAGAGRALLEAAEAWAVRHAGRVMVIETSAREHLARARGFYSRAGYAVCGRVPNFYGEDDDKVIFARQLNKPDD